MYMVRCYIMSQHRARSAPCHDYYTIDILPPSWGSFANAQDDNAIGLKGGGMRHGVLKNICHPGKKPIQNAVPHSPYDHPNYRVILKAKPKDPLIA